MDADDARQIHALRVMHEFGFTDRALAAIRRHRMAASVQDALDRSAATDAPAPHWSDSADPHGPEWAALRAARAKNPLMNGENEL